MIGTARAVIFGCAGLQLSVQERDFFNEAQPWGFILFARNVQTPAQVKALCVELQECVAHTALIFVDQEGGRVQRLGPPYWQKFPPARIFADLYTIDKARARRACWLNYRLIAHDLHALGIRANMVPVLDLPQEDADLVISDRAFGQEAQKVIDLGTHALEGLRAGGVKGVMKHIPGHGRALVDSHKDLPVVASSLSELAQTDFKPFSAFSTEGSRFECDMAMTAHIAFKAVSDMPLTLCKSSFQLIIREMLGYKGLVMSDDMDMQALYKAKPAQQDKNDYLGKLSAQALRAGCDIVLHCSGDLPAMQAVASHTPLLQGLCAARAERAAHCDAPLALDYTQALTEYKKLCL